MKKKRLIKSIAAVMTATIVASSLPLTVAFEGSSLSWPNLSDLKINFANIVNAAEGSWVNNNDSWYYYVDGSPITGWKQINSIWYYFDTTGVMATGWKRVDNIWYYFETSGAMLKSTWKKLNGKWYHFAYNGAMDTGWRKISDVWYYFDTSGAMATGWKKVDNVWYYFETNGIMKTGWNKIDNIWYYFDHTGAMATGWKQINNTWYHFDSNGAMNTGWKKLNNKWYYFYSSGAMATNIDIDGGHIDANGVWSVTENAPQPEPISCGYNKYFIITDDDNDGVPETAHIYGSGTISPYYSLTSPSPFTEHNGEFTNVVFDDPVETIPVYTFYNCTSLQTITIPSETTTLSGYCFMNSGLTEITIPGTVTQIMRSAFSGCSSLTSVNFEDSSVTLTMYDEVFKDCTSLTSFTIPNRLTATRRYNVITGCTSLRELTIQGVRTMYEDYCDIWDQIEVFNVSCYSTTSLSRFVDSSRFNVVHDGSRGTCNLCFPVQISGTNAAEYTYEFIPLFMNSYGYIFVRTENPDPTSFAFFDYDSVYSESSHSSQIPTIKPTTRRFVDIDYDDYTTGRFDGGYICEATYVDGGELTLGQYGLLAPYYYGKYGYEDTSTTVVCPQLYSTVDILIDLCTDENATLWENLSSVSSFLYDYSVYPISLRNSNVQTSYQYGLIYRPAHTDLPLLTDYAPYAIDRNVSSFAMSAYPFVLDSLSYPGVLSAIAVRLNPDATVTNSSMGHAYIEVTLNGETRIYGGAGNQGSAGTGHALNGVFLPEHVTYTYTTAQQLPLDDYYDLLSSYWDAAVECATNGLNSVSMNSVRGYAGADGAWTRIYGGYYTFTCQIYGYGLVDTWVDGRYINQYGFYHAGATFADNPTSDILITNVTYTNMYGNTITGDVIYEYNATEDAWVGYMAYGSAYANSTVYRRGSVATIQSNSPNLVLTREQVEAMNIDGNTNVDPAHGIICDGTVIPGTPF